MSLEFCTLNDGTKFYLYEIWRNICIALDFAIELEQFAIATIGNAMTLIIDGQFKIPLWNADGTSAITIPAEKTFWAWRLSFVNDSFGFNIPLLKTSIKSIWQMLVHPIDIEVSGTENWQFRKPDGSWDYGYNFSPTRKLRILADIVPAGKYVFFIYAIKKILEFLD